MSWKCRIKRCTAWLAAAAVLLGALTPTLSLAVGGSGEGSWATVCSAAGEKRVRVDASNTEPKPTPVGHGPLGPHCPYCSSHLAALVTPPVQATLVPRPVAEPAVVERSVVAPDGTVWLRRQPRGPPPADIRA